MHYPPDEQNSAAQQWQRIPSAPTQAYPPSPAPLADDVWPHNTAAESDGEAWQTSLSPAKPDEPSAPKKRSIFKPRLKKPNFILSVLINAVRIAFLLVLLGGLALGGIVVGIGKAYMETAPTLDLALLDDQAKTSFIYDSNNQLITDYKGTENRVMASIDTIPLNLQHAFVAVEDARFYTHNGVDIKRIIGSFVKNFVSNTNQGGSTITQQLIKNTVLSNEQSYKRKIQEAYLAMQLETQYTKDQILECYLNTIYMGENYYGVAVAAEGYFGKQLQQLTLRECAMLAGLTNNPYYYNPRRNFYLRASEETDYAALTNDRTDYVLKCMYENQFITRQQYDEAMVRTTASVTEKSQIEGEGMYPYAHFVEYAVRDVINKFLELEGLPNTSENRAKMETKLRTGGYRVTLTMDTEIQKIVEDTLATWSKYPGLRDPSDKVYRARNSDGTYTEIEQPQAAAVVLDYRTGELKAIVGGRTPPTQRKTLNRACDMQMPVGSSIKPIAVYAPAIDLGASPASIVYNMPLPIAGWKDGSGKDTFPKNFGGGNYDGPQTLRSALKNSRNVSAAQTLLSMVGVERSVNYLMRMGVSEQHIDKTPFGLSLGSSGISPVEMSVAFGVLGNGGVYQEPISFLGISDSNGNVIYDSHEKQQRQQVFRPSTAWMVVDMLKTAVSSGTGTRAKISGQTVAGKTGTNSDQRGVFFCGMTGWYSSAVWIGHDNYKPLSSKATGSTAAAPLWQSYMAKIHTQKGLDNHDIMQGSPDDYGLVKATTCAVSGQLATDACRNDAMGYGTVTDYWLESTVPTTQCQMHKAMIVCAESGMLANEYCPVKSSRGMVVIPQGHPLYQFISSSTYSPVLQQYLGSISAAQSADANYLSAISCTWHGPGSSGSGSTVAENALAPDARLLIQSAQNALASLDPASGAYAQIFSAIQALQSLVDNPASSTADMAAGMGQLTQAMALAQ